MFIAMNRFRIVPGREDEFIEIWQRRETYLDEVPGFKTFHLLRGPSNDEHTLFASHSTWESASDFLTATERDQLAFSGKLLALMIGIRFLTDHIMGDVYFKTRRPDHNLDRARNQFKLVSSIEEQEQAMHEVVAQICQ